MRVVFLSKYESGRADVDPGAISAGDMATKAALTKIMYLLDLCSTSKELKQQFQTNTAGESTK